MMKIVAACVSALFFVAGPPAHAQAPDAGVRLSTADLSKLTDARIKIVKFALQLTPDQEKYWPPVEDAIRIRAKDRQARIASAEQRVSELRGQSPVEALANRNPVEFLQRRADALAQRSADLKKLADAWQPLYQTLSSDQRQRMGFLTIFVLREMRDALEDDHMQFAQADDEEE
jgi:hypothetical protein